MNGMAMDGAHAMSMSMAWAPGPGESWLGAAASFLAMWTAMMMAMMLPSVAPTFRRYHRMVSRLSATRPVRLTAIAAVGYLAVWAAVGVVVFPAEMEASRVSASLSSRTTAILVAIVVLAAGAVQFTKWKARHLACCREPRVTRDTTSGDVAGAWRFGARLGWHCVNSSAALTLMLLAVGMMDPRAMAAVTGAIAAERLAPTPSRVARAVGVVAMCVGLVLIARG